MGVGRSKKVVDTSNVEFTVPIRNLRIASLNNYMYSSFDPGFRDRFSLIVWSEFRQSVETAVNSYTHDPQLTHWKGTYKCLSMLVMVLVTISAIYSIVAFILDIWVSAVIEITFICVPVLSVCRKLSTLKEAYHRQIEQRVGNAMQQLNSRYNGICHFQMEKIAAKSDDFFDFSIRLCMFFRITLFEQQVNPQCGALGQPQSVMVQMPGGQMVMAQVVPPPPPPPPPPVSASGQAPNIPQPQQYMALNNTPRAPSQANTVNAQPAL